MADATPIASADPVQTEAAQVSKAKPTKTPAKTLVDGFVIPEGAVQIESHEAYRMDF
ncbi:hypothetical protein [Burkholderia cepacia]|uniref:hypothetical protein n=1 Tax=Burkholderia cepacia TaxID=292 RepID=UPI001CF2FD66|nr:hypothetical protein [Burkholderia cepacia]MCA8110260.1 hypothetical protein [Burkholderia cepacia]MCA8396559.1 hypothetical protein [Burkholderia cepacia]